LLSLKEIQSRYKHLLTSDTPPFDIAADEAIAEPMQANIAKIDSTSFQVHSHVEEFQSQVELKHDIELPEFIIDRLAFARNEFRVSLIAKRNELLKKLRIALDIGISARLDELRNFASKARDQHAAETSQRLSTFLRCAFQSSVQHFGDDSLKERILQRDVERKATVLSDAEFFQINESIKVLKAQRLQLLEREMDEYTARSLRIVQCNIDLREQYWQQQISHDVQSSSAMYFKKASIDPRENDEKSVFMKDISDADSKRLV
jgi:hypothetical protein